MKDALSLLMKEIPKEGVVNSRIVLNLHLQSASFLLVHVTST